MTLRWSIGCAVLAMTAVPAAYAAQAASPAATVAVAPDRLAAAHKLIDLVMPPARRDIMLDAIIRPMMANIRQSIAQSPQFHEAGGDPRIGSLVEQFLAEQQESSLADLKANMPTMLDAIARAYARRFTTAQLDELAAFFKTPTGHAYVEQAPTVMSDPDVLAWQRQLMGRSLTRIQRDAKTLADRIAALGPAKPGS